MNWPEVIAELESNSKYWHNRALSETGVQSKEHALQLICLAQTFNVLAMAFRKGIGQ